MVKIKRHVLKADEVVLREPFRLGVDPTPRPGGAEPACASGEPRVRVAQSHPEYAVIEVTCACGKTTYIRCEYGTAKRPAVQG